MVVTLKSCDRGVVYLYPMFRQIVTSTDCIQVELCSFVKTILTTKSLKITDLIFSNNPKASENILLVFSRGNRGDVNF